MKFLKFSPLLISSYYISHETVSMEAPYKFKSGVALMPHPEKFDKGGEDAFAVDKTLIAVADGVGGWAD